MDDETLKLLTAILTGQQEFRAEFNQFRVEVNARFDRVEKRQENLEKRQEDLEKQQENLRKYVVKFNQRFDQLGEQVVAIGLEVKDDVRFVLDKVDRMSIDVFTERAENARNRVDYFEVQKRLTKIEDAIRAA